MKKTLVAFMCLFVCAAVSYGQARVPAAAQGSPFKEGEKEVGVSASVMAPSKGDQVWMIMGSFGYFLTTEVQVKGTAMLFGTKDMTMGILGASGDYLFATDLEFVPYAGAGLLTSIGDIDMGLLLDVHGGVKQFISEHTSINYEAKYMQSITTDEGGMFIATIGLSYYF